CQARCWHLCKAFASGFAAQCAKRENRSTRSKRYRYRNSQSQRERLSSESQKIFWFKNVDKFEFDLAIDSTDSIQSIVKSNLSTRENRLTRSKCYRYRNSHRPKEVKPFWVTLL